MNKQVKGKNVFIRYMVYEMFNMFHDGKQVIKPVVLERWTDDVHYEGEIENSFETEEEAFEAIIDAGRTHEDLLIIKTVYIN